MREIIKRWRKLSENKKMVHNIPQVRQMITMLEEQENRIAELEEGMLENMALGIQASIDFYIKNTASAIQGHIDYGILGKAEASDPDSIPIEILQRDIKALRKQSKGGAE